MIEKINTKTFIETSINILKLKIKKEKEVDIRNIYYLAVIFTVFEIFL